MMLRIAAAGLIIFVGLNTWLTAQEMPAPSAEHKILMRDVGEWDITGKIMMPDGVQEFKGAEKVIAIGGFWTVSDYSADVLGGLRGSLTLGFDPTKEVFVGSWVDSYQPSPTHMEGTFDEDSKTMTFETSGIGMDGKPMAGKIIVRYIDRDSHTFTMMNPDPTGESQEMVKTMEMTYTRKPIEKKEPFKG